MIGYDWIRIENRKTWLIEEIPKYHPDSIKHTNLWRSYKRMIVEGMWGPDFGKFRYMPPNLFFYVNFCTILHVDKKTKTRNRIRPWLRDIEWELSYMCFEAKGFSGWSDDDEYTSNELWFDYQKDGVPVVPDLNLINKNGQLKKYITPRENIRKLHDKPMGLPLYSNNCKNTMVLGSRGGGKSYFYSLAEHLHELITDGAKYYDEESRLNPAEIHQLIGSGATDKSSEFCDKIKSAMDAFAIDSRLGTWGKPGDDDYEPSPLYKDMQGSLKPNNAMNPWRHEYEKKVNGRWVKGFGTNSKIVHVNYRDKEEAGAGGRFTISTIEEVGLTDTVIGAHNSNIATTQESSLKFGRQHYLGTSGNIEKIKPAKEMFTNVDDYDIVSYDDIWEHSGKIGFFLSAAMVNNDFKDENGNTNIEEAVKYYEERREKAKQSSNPKTLEVEMMNYPIVPSDMWVGKIGKVLPVEEAKLREKELMQNNMYQNIGTHVKLIWDPNAPEGVRHEVDMKADPLHEVPARRDQNVEGCITIYHFPERVHGVIPNDMYKFIGHDPYVSDNQDEGNSLGATYMIMNPKYTTMGFPGGQIVASYVGKPYHGKKVYYENQEKLLQMYGNPHRGLWYEANRGEFCRSYYHKKNKINLLCLRPVKEQGASIYLKPTTNYGWLTGNKISKMALIDMLADWLKEESEYNGIKKQNIFWIPEISLIKEIIGFDFNSGNWDRIMALVGAVLGIREEINEYEEKLVKKHNPLKFLSMNNKVFKERRYRHSTDNYDEIF